MGAQRRTRSYLPSYHRPPTTLPFLSGWPCCLSPWENRHHQKRTFIFLWPNLIASFTCPVSFCFSLVDCSSQDTRCYYVTYFKKNFFFKVCLFHPSVLTPASSFLDSAGSLYSKTHGERTYCWYVAFIFSSSHSRQASCEWTPEQSIADPSFPEALSLPLNVGRPHFLDLFSIHMHILGWSLSSGLKCADDSYIYISSHTLHTIPIFPQLPSVCLVASYI